MGITEANWHERVKPSLGMQAGSVCPLSQILVRLDGLYGNGVVISDLLSSGLGVIVRSKDYGLLDQPASKLVCCFLPTRRSPTRRVEPAVPSSIARIFS